MGNDTEIAEKSAPKVTLREVSQQIVACLIAHSIVIQAGINLCYSAVLLPQLEDDPAYKITADEASWIASLVTISLPLGSVIVGPLVDKYGRKRIIATACVLFAIGWIVQATATTLSQIYVSRIVSGFTGGLTTASLIYVSETAHRTYRAMLLSLNSVFVSFGILLTCLLGKWFAWHRLAYVFAGLSACSFLLVLAIPESPYWLYAFHDDVERTRTSLRRLFKNEQILDEQFEEISKWKNGRMESQTVKDERSHLLRLKERFVSYKQAAVYKPVLLLIGLFVLQQLAGAYVLVVYAVAVFRAIGSNYAINEYTSLIWLGLIRFVMSIISALIAKSVGRRVLLFLSAGGMLLASAVAGVYCTLTTSDNIDNKTTPTDVKVILPLICLLLYVCFGSLGFLVVPWTLIGEVLPTKIKGTMGGFLISFAYVLMSIVIKTFPFLLDRFEMNAIFVFMAFVNLIAIAYVRRYLPETLGKHFSEIEEAFK